MTALAVNQFEFYVLMAASHHLAGAVVIYVAGAEYWLAVVGAEGLELLEVTEELGCDILEVQICVDIDRCLNLIGLDMGRYILLKAALELLYILNLE